MKIGDRIKELRESKKISQRQLAELINMSPSQYSRVERNLVDPRISTIDKICKGLSITFYDFFLTYRSIDKEGTELINKLKLIEQLSKEEQESIFNLIETFLKKNKSN